MSPDSRERLPQSQDRASAAIALLAVLAYVIATLATRPYWTGDSADYADSIVMWARGTDYNFWDPGHLVWRPLGYLVFRAIQPIVGWTAESPSAVATAEQTITWMCWLCGLASAGLLALWLGRVAASRLAAALTALVLIVGHGFLTFSQTGLAYVPGLAFLLLGLYLLSSGRGEPRRSLAAGIGAGVALACAVLIWLPYALVLPGALLSPLLLFGASGPRWRLVAVSTVACAIVGLVTYGAVAAEVGVATPAAFVAWLQGASHGISGSGGIPRAVFGFARSFLNMGNDGALVKRYMLGDPHNPVAFGDLLRVSLWKLAIFYAFLLIVVVRAAYTAVGRRALLFLAVAGIPTLAFALAWQAGDMERYMPLLPGLCLVTAAALDARRLRRGSSIATEPLPLARAARAAVVLLVITAAVVNGRALSAAAIATTEAKVVARVGPLAAPGTLPPSSMVVTANWHDELISYARANPGRSINAQERFPLYALVTPRGATSPTWRPEFARRALKTWEQGGQVWIARRALAPRPAPDWNWVEGDDPHVKWADFQRFFAPFAIGPASVGGEDGFVMLPNTPENAARLQQSI